MFGQIEGLDVCVCVHAGPPQPAAPAGPSRLLMLNHLLTATAIWDDQERQEVQFPSHPLPLLYFLCRHLQSLRMFSIFIPYAKELHPCILIQTWCGCACVAMQLEEGVHDTCADRSTFAGGPSMLMLT